MGDRPREKGRHKRECEKQEGLRDKAREGNTMRKTKKKKKRRAQDREGEHMASPSSSIYSQATCHYIHALSGFDLWICFITGSTPPLYVNLPLTYDDPVETDSLLV